MHWPAEQACNSRHVTAAASSLTAVFLCAVRIACEGTDQEAGRVSCLPAGQHAWHPRADWHMPLATRGAPEQRAHLQQVHLAQGNEHACSCVHGAAHTSSGDSASAAPWPACLGLCCSACLGLGCSAHST